MRPINSKEKTKKRSGSEATGVRPCNGAANTLTSGGGDDWLNGGGGADTLVGGIGDDIYCVDNTGDVVTELAGEGTDLAFSSIRTALAPVLAASWQ
nr:hypothetical protein [uncultured Albidiferax sp.]